MPLQQSGADEFDLIGALAGRRSDDHAEHPAVVLDDYGGLLLMSSNPSCRLRRFLGGLVIIDCAKSRLEARGGPPRGIFELPILRIAFRSGY